MNSRWWHRTRPGGILAGGSVSRRRQPRAVGAAMLLALWDDVTAQHLQAALRRQLPASFLSTSRRVNCQKVSAGIARCLWSC